MSADVVPVKCALKFSPPTLVLFYKEDKNGKTRRRSMPLRKFKCDTKIDTYMLGLTNDDPVNGPYMRAIPSAQLVRLLEKIQSAIQHTREKSPPSISVPPQDNAAPMALSIMEKHPPYISKENAPPIKDNAPPTKGNAPPTKDNAPPPKDNAPPTKNHGPPPKDNAPPTKDHAPPPKDNAPPTKDHAPPSKDNAPPTKDHAPPPKDNAPPTKDHAPPSKDHAPPTKDHAPPPKLQLALTSDVTSLRDLPSLAQSTPKGQPNSIFKMDSAVKSLLAERDERILEEIEEEEEEEEVGGDDNQNEQEEVDVYKLMATPPPMAAAVDIGGHMGIDILSTRSPLSRKLPPLAPVGGALPPLAPPTGGGSMSSTRSKLSLPIDVPHSDGGERDGSGEDVNSGGSVGDDDDGGDGGGDDDDGDDMIKGLPSSSSKVVESISSERRAESMRGVASRSLMSLSAEVSRSTTAPSGVSREHSRTTAPSGVSREHSSATAPSGVSREHSSTTAPSGVSRDLSSTTAPSGVSRELSSTTAPSGVSREHSNATAHSGVSGEHPSTIGAPRSHSSSLLGLHSSSLLGLHSSSLPADDQKSLSFDMADQVESEGDGEEGGLPSISDLEDNCLSGEDFRNAGIVTGENSTEDLNRVDEDELAKRKAKMDLLYEANRLKPGDEGYVYDKEVGFENGKMESGWDSDPESCGDF